MPVPREVPIITLVGLVLAAGSCCVRDSSADGWILTGVLGREEPGRCGEHESGERWAVACNECFCDSEGQALCTRLDCKADETSALGFPR